MNNTIAWIMAAFIIATIITDLSAFILMKSNRRAYEQNGNNPCKEKMYWGYLVVSRLAFAMTSVAGVAIGCVCFMALGDLMAQHKTVATYVITACICLAIAGWCATKRNIKESLALEEYNANDPNELEPFIDPKDRITVREIGLWLIGNIILSGIIITMAVCLTDLWKF